MHSLADDVLVRSPVLGWWAVAAPKGPHTCFGAVMVSSGASPLYSCKGCEWRHPTRHGNGISAQKVKLHKLHRNS
eukprot:2249123-Karenia_brevis.AAC.1